MIRIVVDPFPKESAIDEFWRLVWEAPSDGYAARVLQRSLVHLGAYAGEQLVGFVNVAWDGGQHGFLLDTGVAPAFRRQGVATALVKRAARAAQERGAMWLHVDFEPQLEGFYLGCGFKPTAAGLIRLREAGVQ